MRRQILKVMVLVLGLLVWGVAGVQAEPSPSRPQVLAIKMHADWCPGCKAMAPAWEQIQSRMADRPILFVVLDKTTTASARQAGMLAQMLGVAEVYAAHPGTGFVLLVDPRTHALLDTLTPDINADPMAARIDRQLSLAGR